MNFTMTAIGIAFAHALVTVHFVNAQSAILARKRSTFIFVYVAEFSGESRSTEALRQPIFA